MSHGLSTGDYVSVRQSLLVLRCATPENLGEVRRLTEEAVDWLQTEKNTDQWSTPWPDLDRSIARVQNDLRQRKTWLVWDDATPAGTITLDRKEPLDVHHRPVWPTCKRHEPALYVRRVIVSRNYADIGLGAGLLDWASDVARQDYGALLIRVDVWTTNRELHRYYEGQRFTRLRTRQSWELADYPSQALFERHVDQAGSDYTDLFAEEDRPEECQSLYRGNSAIGYL